MARLGCRKVPRVRRQTTEPPWAWPPVVDRPDLHQVEVAGTGGHFAAPSGQAASDMAGEAERMADIGWVDPYDRDRPLVQRGDHQVGGYVIQASHDQHGGIG